MSSIQKWHVGKFAILWGVCALWFWSLMREWCREDLSWWFAYVLFCSVVTCLVVTWVWLSGREGK